MSVTSKIVQDARTEAGFEDRHFARKDALNKLIDKGLISPDTYMMGIMLLDLSEDLISLKEALSNRVE